MNRDDELRLRPGRIRSTRSPRARPFVAQALAAAEKAGGLRRSGRSRPGARPGFGRGGAAALRLSSRIAPKARLVTVKARVVRRSRAAAPLTAHLRYLGRDGVSRDDSNGRLFDASGDDADGGAFAERCRDDRHHFRFIVSPEDAAELSDLKTYTRDVMATAKADLGTNLDWIAIDHWNTAHPHVHVLVRGLTEDGDNLVISRDYISHGFRARASERATLELGPRTEREIEAGLEREVDAERWTSLDRTLERSARDGVVDLRPRFGETPNASQPLHVARMRKLEGLGLAEPLGPGRWRLADDARDRLRALQRRGDIIARLHDALGDNVGERGTVGMVLDAGHEDGVAGRLAARGLDDELIGSVFVVIDGVDGRTHHVDVVDLNAASDAPIGAIVEARQLTNAGNAPGRLVVSVRSDLRLEKQVGAYGATWLDRQLMASKPTPIADAGFGREVRAALDARTDHHLAHGTAERRGDRTVFARNLLATLRRRDLERAAEKLSGETGLMHRPAGEEEHVAGVVRQRVTLASGRFAMIDDGMGFQLVPWSQPLERRLGHHVSGRMTPGGSVDWAFGRQRGLSI